MMTKGQQKKQKRTNYFANKSFQTKYTLYYVLFVLLSNTILALTFGVLASDGILVLYEKYGIHISKTPLVLFIKILTKHWYVYGVILLVVIVAAIILTHRVAGPLVRLEKVMGKMAKGNFDDTVHLRRGDEWHSLAWQINAINDMLAARIAAMRQYSEQMGSQLASANSEMENPELVQAARDHLDKSVELNSRLRDTLTSFTIKHDT